MVKNSHIIPLSTREEPYVHKGRPQHRDKAQRGPMLASFVSSLRRHPLLTRHRRISMQSSLTRMLCRLKTLCRWRGGVCSEFTGDGYSIGLVSVGELAHRPSGT